MRHADFGGGSDAAGVGPRFPRVLAFPRHGGGDAAADRHAGDRSQAAVMRTIGYGMRTLAAVPIPPVSGPRSRAVLAFPLHGGGDAAAGAGPVPVARAMRSVRTVMAVILAWAAPLGAQLAFFQPDGQGGEQRLETQFDAGTAAPGDTLETRVRLRNTGTAAVILNRLGIDGAGFSLANTPALPNPMAPGVNADFRIRFRPTGAGTYSATLRANDTTLLVRATGTASLQLYLNGVEVTNALPVEVGPVEAGSAAVRGFELRNNSGEPITLNRLSATGAGFSVVHSLALPLAVEPSGAASFQVRFEPLRAGVFPGTLSIDGRTIALTGIAQEPPFPEPRIEFEPTAAQSGKQTVLQVRLSSPARAAATATLAVEFRAEVAAGPAATPDPAMAFVATGTRSIGLEIRAGSAVAEHNGKQEIVFQTGTTAGTATYRLTIGNLVRTFAVTIPQEPPRLDAVELRPAAGLVEVIASGFDNARSSGELRFVFTDRAGRQYPLTADAAAAFAAYFRDSAAGGLFQLTARFPVTGGEAGLLTGVEVSLNNGVGTGRGASR